MSAWIAVAVIFLTVGLSIGIRLHLRARASGVSPERFFSLFVLLAFCGWGGLALGVGLADSQAPLAVIASTLGLLVVGAGYSILYFGTWAVYRRDSSLALGLAVSAVVAMVVTLFLVCSSGRVLDPSEGSAGSVSFLLLICGALLWWGLESLRYYGVMRRRLELGLADPLVTDRFRLLAICTLAWAVSIGIIFMSPVLFERPAREIPVLLAVQVLIDLIGLAAGYCALLPPAAYKRFAIRDRDVV